MRRCAIDLSQIEEDRVNWPCPNQAAPDWVYCDTHAHNVPDDGWFHAPWGDTLLIVDGRIAARLLQVEESSTEVIEHF